MELIWKNDALVEKWVCKIAGAVFGLAIVASIAIWVSLFVGHPQRAEVKTVVPTTSMTQLGRGPLALSSLQSEEVQPVFKELVLIGTNTRPDQDRVCSLALRSSGETRTCFMGDTLFFEMKDGMLVFAKERTDLAATLRSLENGLLVCEITRGDRSEMCTLHASAIFSHALEQEPYLEMLKQGAVWGKDVFLSGWGGDEYREMMNKTKISLGPDVYFLQQGDCLWWNGEMWVSESDASCPVTQLVQTSSQGAEFRVWDDSGFSSESIHIGVKTPPKTPFNLDELMTAIRPRSSSEITCQLGKRRVIIREGDWWIRADARWKLVRTTSDLEAFLHHQIPGELFIFEKVETSKGKVTLKGRAFDRMRTCLEPISLVLQTEKKPAGVGKQSTGSPHLAKGRSRAPVVSHSPEEL